MDELSKKHIQCVLYNEAMETNDFSKICLILRNSPELLSDEMRELIAKKLEGSFQAKRGAPRTAASISKKMAEAIEIYQCFRWLVEVDKWQIEAARLRTSEVHAVSESKVKKKVKYLEEGCKWPFVGDFAGIAPWKIRNIELDIEKAKKYPDNKELLAKLTPEVLKGK